MFPWNVARDGRGAFFIWIVMFSRTTTFAQLESFPMLAYLQKHHVSRLFKKKTIKS